MRTFAAAGPGGVPAGWGVRRAARLAFPGSAALAADPVHAERLRVYLTDLLRPGGLAPDAELPGPGAQSYGEMARALIRAAVPPGEQVDLLVLAHRVHDITPGRATAAWLSHVCPGGPLAFAVSDPSPAAAFTALRLVRAYAGGAGLARALLLVVEQPSLPYAPAVPAPLPDMAYGVALLFGAPAPGEHHPAALTPAPADLTAATAGAPGEVTAILTSPLPPGSAAPARVRTASPSRPATGVWWELAGELAESATPPPRRPHRFVVADTTQLAQPPQPTTTTPATASAALPLAAFDLPAVPLPTPLEPAGRQR